MTESPDIITRVLTGMVFGTFGLCSLAVTAVAVFLLVCMWILLETWYHMASGLASMASLFL